MKETATLGGGCFWCTEAIFKRLNGVLSVVSGYSGGDTQNPTYQEVVKGTTNHAESIQIEFDPEVISYEKILEVFFKLHDPTSLNKQGADIGSEYRSEIFYHNEKQKQVAVALIKSIQKNYSSPIVTKVSKFKSFYKAEDYHQNFYENNPESMYCKLVIDPKITKLYKEFKDITKLPLPQ